MKTILTLALVTCSLIINAQNKSKSQRSLRPPGQHTSAKTQTVAPDPTYSFSTYTAPYQPITGTSLNNGLKWDETTFTISLGFNFKLYNDQGSTIMLYSGNILTFEDLNSATAPTGASPIDEDICDRAFDPSTDNEGSPNGISNVSYTVTGTAPNRVCHIEVSNAGFWAENDSLVYANNSFLNFQIRLFETSNMIEFHYGNCSVLRPDIDFFDGTAGFACDMYDFTNVSTGTGSGNLLSGPFANPTMVGFGMGSSTNVVVSGQIQSGRVYRFLNTTSTNTYTAIKKNENAVSISLYPNPAKDKLTVVSADQDLFQHATIELNDLTGRLVYSNAVEKDIHLPVLTQGVYFVKIKSANNAELYNSKLIITE